VAYPALRAHVHEKRDTPQYHKVRVVALNQLHNLVVTAPDDLRARLRDLDRKTLLAT
jgi:hypothetical protein